MENFELLTLDPSKFGFGKSNMGVLGPHWKGLDTSGEEGGLLASVPSTLLVWLLSLMGGSHIRPAGGRSAMRGIWFHSAAVASVRNFIRSNCDVCHPA